MKYLYNSELTPMEVAISDKISENMDKVSDLTITQLAALCEVSPSKITKYAKKLGFDGYKEFIYQLKNDRFKNEDKGSTFEYQKEKIDLFFESFNPTKFQELRDLIFTSDKTYLFGRGPSLKVCEYYEPRLRIATNKNIVSNYDEYLFDLDMENENKEEKLMIVLTVSGKTAKIFDILNNAKLKGMKTVCISAYYNQKLEQNSDLYINLLDRKEMFDKSLIRGRTLFYIYFETLTQECVENPPKIK